MQNFCARFQAARQPYNAKLTVRIVASHLFVVVFTHTLIEPILGIVVWAGCVVIVVVVVIMVAASVVVSRCLTLHSALLGAIVAC